MTVAENKIYKANKQNITPVIEDYLKGIYSLRQSDEPVRTVALAARLNVKPPTVTAMLKTLADLQLIRYEPYRVVEWTEAGEQQRKRAHDVWLHERLGSPPYRFAWGTVESYYSARDVSSDIAIDYSKPRRRWWRL